MWLCVGVGMLGRIGVDGSWVDMTRYFFLMLIHFYVYSYNCLFLESLTTHSLTLLTHQCKNVVMQKKQKINEIKKKLVTDGLLLMDISLYC